MDAPEGNRSRTMKLALIAGLAAILTVVVLIVVSQSGEKGGDTDISSERSGDVASLEQRGDEIGDASAAVTIVEYGDLQCPVCKQYSQTAVPDLLSGPVAGGDAKMRFRNWVIIGPQSSDAAKAALAAGEQDLLWDYVELFYKNQGTENSGYVTDDFLTAIAEEIAGLDVARWQEARQSPKWDAELKAIDEEAQAAGATGTPTVVVSGPAGSSTLQGVPDAAAVEAAVEAAAG